MGVDAILDDRPREGQKGALSRIPGSIYKFSLTTHCHQIILIHGLSIPSLIYASVAPSLAQQGFRVLLYDLYGRGYSDALEGKGEYDTTLYTTQLALLMQRVGWDKAGVVGVSMVSIVFLSTGFFFLASSSSSLYYTSPPHFFPLPYPHICSARPPTPPLTP